MVRDHVSALCAVGLDPELWRLTTIQVGTPEEMRIYIEVAVAGVDAGTALPFVIALEGTGEIVGSTRFHSIAREHRRVEIGFTWIAPRWQRTAVNTEAKYLMLRHAFETWHCARVEFKADADNEPSRRALLRIGAVEEGLLRSYVVSRHRGPRDVRIFSIVSAEWPGLRARLERMLG